MAAPIRIANCSGFYGDRFAAMREMVEGGPIDVLTGDYLAELTMLILWKATRKDPAAGYATTFLRQLEGVLATVAERGIKVVTNAGGLNPAGLADAVRALAARLGVPLNVAHVEGDDLLPRLAGLQAAGHELRHLDSGVTLAEAGVTPVSANAYLGGWGIAAALAAGADVVVCPRVTDASLVVGPAAWRHGWARDDWDALAGAVVAGHVLECGAQTAGGNYSFFTEIADLRRPGFPLAEVHADGSSVITKHPGTGGTVSVGTVTAQLLYEIGPPEYAGPDVVTHFDTIRLAPAGPDRVQISDVRGSAAPADLKVCLNHVGGYRNRMEFVLTGLDVEAKAALAEAQLRDLLPTAPAELDVTLVRTDVPDAPTNEAATALLRVTAKDSDEATVGRAFSNAAVEMALASYPGFSMTGPPTGATAYGVYWPALVPASEVEHVVVHADGRREVIEHSPTGGARAAATPARAAANPARTPAPAPTGATRRGPLGSVAGARSGDKGGNANVGLWARTDAGYGWLASYLTVERFRLLLPEAADLAVDRYELANLRALNFVVVGLLGEGVSSSTRADPQAKGLGEYLRSRLVDVPVALLAATSGSS